jgi:parallel beta-helix repeat protein
VVCDHTNVGILLDGSGARLQHGAVTGCTLAISIGGLGHHRVRGVTASASNQGVLVESDGNFLLLSRVLRGVEDAAVQVDGADNQLSGNDIAGSTDQGFEINGNRNRVVGNRIASVAEGVQIKGEGNQILRNEMIGTTDRGVEVREGAHRIAGNLIADGTADGIAVLSDGNQVTDNTIVGNGDQGLFVSGSRNTLERNQVLLNRVDLTDTTKNCDANLWRDNTFETSESDGCVD